MRKNNNKCEEMAIGQPSPSYSKYGMMKKLSKEKVNQIINEEIEKLFLVEELGISKDVIDIANNLADVIISKTEQQPPIYDGQWGASWVDENGENKSCWVYGYIFNIDVSNEMKDVCPLIQYIILKITAFDDFNGYAANADKYNFEGNSVAAKHVITIETPMFDGKLKKKHFLPMLAHEVEHMYQYYRSQKEEEQMVNNRLYTQATLNVNNEDAIIQDVASLIYFFSDKEIDAMAHETYEELIELVNHGKEPQLKYTRPSSYLQTMMEVFNGLKAMDPNELGKKLKIFGISREKFIRYMRGQMNKFQWRMRRTYFYFREKENPRGTRFGGKQYDK